MYLRHIQGGGGGAQTLALTYDAPWRARAQVIAHGAWQYLI